MTCVNDNVKLMLTRFAFPRKEAATQIRAHAQKHGKLEENCFQVNPSFSLRYFLIIAFFNILNLGSV